MLATVVFDVPRPEGARLDVFCLQDRQGESPRVQLREGASCIFIRHLEGGGVETTRSVAARRVNGAPSSRVHEVQWLAAGAVAGALDLPGGSRPSPRSWIEASGCATDQIIGRYPATLEGGTWNALLPAGACLDLQLMAPRFVPVVWSGVRVEAGGEVELPVRVLRLAASLLLRTVGDEGEAVPGVRVELFPGQAWREVVQEGLRPSGELEPIARGRTDEDGWLRFEGLPPDVPLFARFVPSESFSPLVWEPDELPRGVETFAGDVVLERAARLDVAPIAGRSSEMEHLRVRAEAGASCGWLQGATVTARAEDDGSFTFGALSPGLWTVTAADRKAGAWIPVAEPESVSLAPGDRRTVELDLLDYRLEGRVVDGARGIAADLVFRSRNPRAPRLATTSDDEGEFTLHTGSTPGVYDVLVAWGDRDSRRTVTVPGLTLEDTDEPVVVQLPEGEIRGVVLDGDGRPVPGARVSLDGELTEEGERPAIAMDFAKAAADGSFVFDHLAPGVWQVAATVGGEGERRRRSTPVVLFLVEDEMADGVQLRLEEPTIVEGHILSSDGRPVPGAVGFLQTDRGFASVKGDDDGRFEVTLGTKQTGGAVDLVLEAPGFAATASRVWWTAGEPVIVELQRDGGTLEVILALAAAHLAAPPPISVLLVSEGGVSHRPNLLPSSHWRTDPQADGGVIGRLVVPRLATGNWRVELQYRVSGVPPLSLGTVEILPGQTATVEIPPQALEGLP